MVDLVRPMLDFSTRHHECITWIARGVVATVLAVLIFSGLYFGPGLDKFFGF
jgi:hypothetical protein